MVLMALFDISSKLPIGVETMYRPFFSFIIIIPFTFLISCTPVNKQYSQNTDKINNEEYVIKNKSVFNKKYKEPLKKKLNEKETNKSNKVNINKTITALFLKGEREKIKKQFINVLEYAVNTKNLNNISIQIKYFESQGDLEKFLSQTANNGKIYIGPFSNTNTIKVRNYCSKGAIFFSFSSNIKTAGDCIYLINFFPENELRVLLSSQKKNSKIAFLYPENEYGYYINNIIDNIVNQTETIIVNRSSYKEDLSNVRNSIKELGKYELRKYELERQIKILSKQSDNKSKQRLLKLEKFKTVSDYDFTHLLIADYGLRLLEVAPLLPYYDIDPNIITFMSTGVLDDENFFNEPSLQGAIFPGIELQNRSKLIDDYEKIYNDKFIRISTIPYDIAGILNYIFQKNLTLDEVYKMLNNSNLKFEGVDGSFYFKNNIIERELDILKIEKGLAKKIN